MGILWNAIGRPAEVVDAVWKNRRRNFGQSSFSADVFRSIQMVDDGRTCILFLPAYTFLALGMGIVDEGRA